MRPADCPRDEEKRDGELALCSHKVKPELADQAIWRGALESMNWLKLAFGLIREAAGTEAGQEVINNMRSSVRKETSDAPPAPAVDIEALVAEHRMRVNRSLEAIVEKLNEQNSRLEATIRSQRIYNYGLAAALVIVLVAAIIAAR